MLHHSGFSPTPVLGMDPQSAAFTPHNDFWRLHSDMLRVQQTQVDHAERLARLERRQEEDARVKSVWGSSSPFPSVLGGTPQQVPLQHPPEPFSNFDDNQGNLLGSLHLDADDEPRRVGASSRANSVRFDESANQGWAHSSRTSLDLIPRTGSGLGGHPMSERTYSHKSDGRQSSAGHSVHSATSGRANSMGIDITFGANHSTSPFETPGLAPGLFILGSVPAIIRCWLNTNFKHDSLLYAAVCTGSYTSFLDSRLVDHLGFRDQVEVDDEGVRKIKIAVYLPEAIPHPASSRSASPAPQIPSFTVTFTLTDQADAGTDSKAIQIFLGSDVLRAHNADILFSSNTMTMFDDDRSKLSIPLVRPENDKVFKSLFTTSGRPTRAMSHPQPAGLAQSEKGTDSESPKQQAAPMSTPDTERELLGGSSDDGTSATPASSRQSLEHRPVLGMLNTRTESKEAGDASSSGTGSFSRSSASPAIWNSWRRDAAEKPASMDWSSATKSPSQTYQRRDTGIKVLKPTKPTSRAMSTTSLGAASPNGTQASRFFDDGKRRVSTSAGEGVNVHGSRAASSGDPKSGPSSKDSQPSLGKPRSANPIGGASAFSWLNSGAAQAK